MDEIRSQKVNEKYIGGKEIAKKSFKKAKRVSETSTVDLDYTRERSIVSLVPSETTLSQEEVFNTSDLVSYHRQDDPVNVVDLLKYLGYKAVPAFMKDYVKESDYNFFKKL